VRCGRPGFAPLGAFRPGAGSCPMKEVSRCPRAAAAWARADPESRCRPGWDVERLGSGGAPSRSPVASPAVARQKVRRESFMGRPRPQGRGPGKGNPGAYELLLHAVAVHSHSSRSRRLCGNSRSSSGPRSRSSRRAPARAPARVRGEWTVLQSWSTAALVVFLSGSARPPPFARPAALLRPRQCKPARSSPSWTRS